MRQLEVPAASMGPVVPVGPTAGGAASRSAVQLRRGPLAVHGPSWSLGRRCLSEHATQCWSCRVTDGVVHQVGLSGTARGSTELVKAHTPSRDGPSCCNRDCVETGRSSRSDGALSVNATSELAGGHGTGCPSGESVKGRRVAMPRRWTGLGAQGRAERYRVLRQLRLPLRGAWALSSPALPWAGPGDLTTHHATDCTSCPDSDPRASWAGPNWVLRAASRPRELRDADPFAARAATCRATQPGSTGRQPAAGGT
jgi:hypothetical protein